jgi:hypothetical protein
MSDAHRSNEFAVRFQDSASESGAVQAHGPYPDISGSQSLFDSGFQVVNYLLARGVIPLPRYGEMRRFHRRLSSSPYRGLDANLRLEKLILHVDGFMVNSYVNLRILHLGSFGAKLRLLWRMLRTVTQQPLGWYTYVCTKPQTIEERATAANLAMNKAISLDPATCGPDLYDVEDGIICNIHNVQVPDLDVLRFHNQAVTNMTRIRMRLTPKLGPECRTDSSRYRQNEDLVDSYYEFRAGPLRHVKKLLELRREGKTPRLYARQILACAENYSDSLLSIRGFRNKISYYLALDKPSGRPEFSPTSWVDPLKKKGERRSLASLFGPIRTQGRLTEISQIQRKFLGMDFPAASWEYIRYRIRRMKEAHPPELWRKASTFFVLENSKSLEIKGVSSKIPRDLIAVIEPPDQTVHTSSAEMVDERNAVIDPGLTRDLIVSNDAMNSTRQVLEASFRLGYEAVLRHGTLLEGGRSSFNSVPLEWWNQGYVNNSDLMRMLMGRWIAKATSVHVGNPQLDRPSAEWIVFIGQTIPEILNGLVPGTQGAGSSLDSRVGMLAFTYASVKDRLWAMGFSDPAVPMDTLIHSIPLDARRKFFSIVDARAWVGPSVAGPPPPPA